MQLNEVIPIRYRALCPARAQGMSWIENYGETLYERQEVLMRRDTKIITRQKRHWRIRKRVIGSPEKPRMCVFRSLRNMYVQLIDDMDGKTILACGTLSKNFKDRFPERKNNRQAAAILGELVAEEALRRGIEKVVFDRGGYKYHGRIQALTEAARKKGLKF